MENTEKPKTPTVLGLNKDFNEFKKETNDKLEEIKNLLVSIAAKETKETKEIAKEEIKPVRPVKDDNKFLGEEIVANPPAYERIKNQELNENFKMISTLQAGIATGLKVHIIPPDEFKENKHDVRSKVIGYGEPDNGFREFCIVVRKNIVARLGKEGRSLPEFMKHPEDMMAQNQAFSFER